MVKYGPKILLETQNPINPLFGFEIIISLWLFATNFPHITPHPDQKQSHDPSILKTTCDFYFNLNNFQLNRDLVEWDRILGQEDLVKVSTTTAKRLQLFPNFGTWLSSCNLMIPFHRMRMRNFKRMEMIMILMIILKVIRNGKMLRT